MSNMGKYGLIILTVSLTQQASKISSAKAIEKLHRESQTNDTYGKNFSTAPPVVTKSLSKGHKHMKYTHGNVETSLLLQAYH